SLRQPRPLTAPLVPYTTLFRSVLAAMDKALGLRRLALAVYQRLLRCLFGLPCHLKVGVAGLRMSEYRVLQRSADRARRSRRQGRSEEHTSELQSRENLVCRLLL